MTYPLLGGVKQFFFKNRGVMSPLTALGVMRYRLLWQPKLLAARQALIRS